MLKNAFIKKATQSLFYFTACALLIACGENKLESNTPTNEDDSPRSPSFSGTYSGSVNIDLSAEPQIQRDSLAGTTQIILQFVPRSADNTPLSPEEVKVSLLINGEEIDRESMIESSSEQLAFNVNLGLVLDASSSMTYPTEEPAFTAMLEAAKNSIQTGAQIWAEQEGDFSFHTTWFNNYILSSINDENNIWTAESIQGIPFPRKRLDFTRLYAASDYAIERMSENVNEPLSDVKDQNIILIFSDGDDNKSSHDDSEVQPKYLTTEDGDDYVQLGREGISLNTLVENINNQENISVHVIGMGDQLNTTALEAIAEAGGGFYLPNPDASDLEKPFQRVIQEFTTLQTHGVITPIPAGNEYTFTLRVENATGRDSVDCSFQIRIEAESAEIVKEDNAQTCAP